MVIDEAIANAKKVAKENKAKVPIKFYDDDVWTPEQESYMKCAEEHEQLAAWLEELKKLRETAAIEKRTNGQWKTMYHVGTSVFECSLCKGLAPAKYTYCPNCGAYMKKR